jgi:hypothetical protein
MAAAVNTFIAYAFQAIAMYFLAQRAFPLPYEYMRVVKIVAVSIGFYLVNILLPEVSAEVGFLVKIGLLITYPIWLVLVGFWTPDEVLLGRRILGNFSEILVKYAR